MGLWSNTGIIFKVLTTLENSGNFKYTPGIFVSVIVGIEFCA